MVSYRPRLLGVTLIIVAVLLLSLRCDPVEQRKVMTFFFDGVPPVGGGPQDKQTESVTAGPQRARAARKGVEIPKVIVEHAPIRDCATCHGQSDRKSFSLQVKVVRPVPALCYGCHQAHVPAATVQRIWRDLGNPPK